LVYQAEHRARRDSAAEAAENAASVAGCAAFGASDWLRITPVIILLHQYLYHGHVGRLADFFFVLPASWRAEQIFSSHDAHTR
jgi:hypothetical protein